MKLVTMEKLLELAGLNYLTMKENVPCNISEKKIKVKSFNHEKGLNEYKLITHVTRKPELNIARLVTESGDILLKCSFDHEIFDSEKEEYIEVGKIESGVILCEDGKDIEFFVQKTSEKMPLIDITVDGNSNYFSNGVLSHNCGGRALAYATSLRIDIRKIGFIKDGAGEILGNRCKVRIIKNKIAAPFKTCEFDIMYGLGVDKYGEVIDLACGFNIIEKKGAWFAYGSQNIGQGMINTVKFLRENDDVYNTIRNEVLEKMYEEIAGEAGEDALIQEDETQENEVPTEGENNPDGENANVNGNTEDDSF